MKKSPTNTPRLVAFGCSLTYGHGLPDCYEPPHFAGAAASRLSWCELVSKTLNRHCLNLSTPGSSNKRIWHTVNTFQAKPGDLAVIMWSFAHRNCIIKSKDCVKDILSPNNTYRENETDRAYYRHIYDAYDSEVMSKLYVEHATARLQRQGATVINLSYERENQSWFDRVQLTKVFFSDIGYQSMPRALDNSHPGVEAHRKFADDLLSNITV